MTQKNKDAFRVWTGFKFGFGFYLAFRFGMALEDTLLALLFTFMKGLGFMPGMIG
jgi:hypothetical protein